MTHPDGKTPRFSRPSNQEQTTIKSLALSGGYGGAPCSVDYKDGRVIRIRPLHFDEKYDPQQFNLWKIEAGGKVFEPVLKSHPSPFSLAYKKRALSPNRIQYPLKRVDWDPNGERNPQNRGKSKYKRISWDEAAEIIANEIKRVHKQYGPLAFWPRQTVMVNAKWSIPPTASPFALDKMGGFTQQVRNPDSWEGWYLGHQTCLGRRSYRALWRRLQNIFKDMTQNMPDGALLGLRSRNYPLGFQRPVRYPSLLFLDGGRHQAGLYLS